MGNSRVQPPLFEPGEQLRQHRLHAGAVFVAPIIRAPANVIAHVQAADRDVLDQQQVGRDLLNGAPGETHRHNTALWRDAAQGLFKHLAAHRVINRIGAPAVGDLQHLVAEGPVAVVDAMVRAVGLDDSKFFGRSGGGDHSGAEDLADLDRGYANPTRPAVDQ